MNVVITGASRGIGLGLTRSFLADGDQVWACCRMPEQAHALQALDNECLHLVRWDVAVDDAPQPQGKAFPASVHLLINNAGIYGPDKQAQSLSGIQPKTMLEVFNVDAVGPLRVVQYLQSHLAPGGMVVNISSKMGSVADNSSGGTYAYRAAKAALNIITKSLAVDLAARNIHVLALHPGWVRTDMTGHHGLIDIDTSVAGLRQVMAQGHDYAAGSLVAFDGQRIPW